MQRSGRKIKSEDLFADQAFVRRLVEVREKKGWGPTRLAERLEEIGFKMSRVTLSKLENPASSRKVTLREVFAISYALDVSPLYMLVPLESVGDVPGLAIAGNVEAHPRDARAWLRGDEPLSGQDHFSFVMERAPEDIADALKRYPHVAHQLQRSWRPPAAEAKTMKEEK